MKDKKITNDLGYLTFNAMNFFNNPKAFNVKVFESKEEPYGVFDIPFKSTPIFKMMAKSSQEINNIIDDFRCKLVIELAEQTDKKLMDEINNLKKITPCH